MKPDTGRSDVIIIGGGPVGMGLAIELGQRGVDCTVVERYPKPQPVPKGQNLTQRTGEHFRAWGVSQAIRDASPIPHDYGSEGITAYGSVLSGYSYDWHRRAQVRDYYCASHERLPQYETENVLRRRAAELKNVKLLYGWAADDIAQSDSSVTVDIAEHKGSGRRNLKARYAVGCDGSRSVVRGAAGIEQDVETHDKRMVLLVFKSPALHELLERFPGKCYYNVLKPELEGYWQFLGRVDLGTTWFFHAPVPEDTRRDNFDFAACLQDAVGAEFDIEFDYIGFWDLRIAAAKTYGRGRVFIAGDAAHSHPPYGGYGINTGFEDARNLGWKLAATVGGWAGPGLLDSYSAERQPVFVSMADHFIAGVIRQDREFLSNYDPQTDKPAFEAAWNRRASGGNVGVTGFVPNYAGSPVVFGPLNGHCSAVGTHEFRARAGHHLAPRALSSNAGLCEALGSDFSLLAFDAAADTVSSFAQAAGELRIPLTIVEDSRDGERRDYGAPLILVRPDHFIAWAGDAEAAEARKILERSVGAG